MTKGTIPQMYHWLCAYCLIVVPVSWVLYHLTCCSYQFTFRENSSFFGIEVLLLLLDEAVSIVLTALYVSAGWNLRALRRSGVLLFQIAFWGSLGFMVFFILSSLVLLLAATATPIDQFAPPTETADLLALLDLGFLILACCALAFEIVAMVWLYRNRNQLPLSAAAQTSWPVN